MSHLRILHVHNYYKQPGGEDTAFESEVFLLRQRGHQVIEFTEDNHRIEHMPFSLVGLQSLWSWETYQKISKILVQEHPDIVHFHNTFPLISPSAYYACSKFEIPVIQSLDNPRLLCLSANFYRNGKLCQDCLGKTPPLPGIFHGCYHQSSLQSVVVASMLSLHRWLKTWSTKVDNYLVATDFYKAKFIEGGLPPERIIVKPHFIYPDPNSRLEGLSGKYVLFIGRLDPEKGVRTLLQAWKQITDIPLKIRGAGQLQGEVVNIINANRLDNVELLGRLHRGELTELIQNARFLIWPSEGYYETFGYVAVESFGCGVPVIASRIGVCCEMITDGVTGLHFNPGDPNDLAEKVRWAWVHPDAMAILGKNARREYEEKYTTEKNYELLMGIYQRAIRIRK